jgi:hypothetical protein
MTAGIGERGGELRGQLRAEEMIVLGRHP